MHRVARSEAGLRVSLELGRRLRLAGLEWTPQLHDLFAIPDRGLDDRIFALSDMTIDMEFPGGEATIMFNGAVEWSLDFILQTQVVWLPTEGQVRELLGDRLVSFGPGPEGFRCLIHDGRSEVAFHHVTAAEAYGLALLHLLQVA